MQRLLLTDDCFVELPVKACGFLMNQDCELVEAEKVGGGDGVLVRGVLLHSTASHYTMSCGGLYAKVPCRLLPGPFEEGGEREFFVRRRL